MISSFVCITLDFAPYTVDKRPEVYRNISVRPNDKVVAMALN